MKNHKDTLKTYLIPVASFFVCIALIPLVIIPQLNRIASDSGVINKNRDRLGAIQQKAKDLEEKLPEKDQINYQLNYVEKVLPISKAIAPLVLGVQQLALSNSLAVSEIKLQPGKVATSSAQSSDSDANSSSGSDQGIVSLVSTDKEIVFRMSLTGNLVSLESFLGQLEKGQRLLLLRHLTVQQSGSAYNIQVFLSAPFSKLPALSTDQIATLKGLSEEDNRLLNQLLFNNKGDITTTTIPTGPTGVLDPFQP